MFKLTEENIKGLGKYDLVQDEFRHTYIIHEVSSLDNTVVLQGLTKKEVTRISMENLNGILDMWYMGTMNKDLLSF